MPHPDDPDDYGYAGRRKPLQEALIDTDVDLTDREVAERDAARIRSGRGRMPYVGEPENAAPAPTAITNEQEATDGE